MAGRRSAVVLDSFALPIESVALVLTAARDGVVLRVTSGDGSCRRELRLTRDRSSSLECPVARAPLDLRLEAELPGESVGGEGALLALHEIRLRRRHGLGGIALRSVPVLFAALVVGLGWRRRHVWALPWAVVVAASAAWACAWLVDRDALLVWRPLWQQSAREVLLVAAAVLCVATARRSWASALAGLALLTALLYLPTVGYGFVDDDFVFARRWDLMELLRTFWSVWDPRGLSNPHYRPIVASDLALEWRLWGGWPPGYHLSSLVIAAGAAVGLGGLFERLGAPRHAALAGACAWLAHPFTATAVAWANARTDSLAVCFTVWALYGVVAPRLGRREIALTWLLTWLAMGSKEMALPLPLLAVLSVAAALGLGALRERTRVVAISGQVVLAALHTLLAARVAPGRIASTLAGGGELATTHWPGLIANVYREWLWPQSYSWAQRWVGDEGSGLPLAMLLLIATALLVALARGRGRRLVPLALAWPLVTLAPLLAVLPMDIYRRGALVSVGFGIAVAALLTLARRPWIGAAATSMLVLCLAPRAIDSAAQWGPGGSAYETMLHLRARKTPWLAGLSPEMRALFERQLRARNAARGRARAMQSWLNGSDVPPDR